MSVRTMWDNDNVEFMDTSDSPWCWYYMADCGRWHRFEDDPDSPLKSEDIEMYYLRDSKAALNTSSSKCHGKIDFSAMLQTDSTGTQRRILRSGNIERSCSCFSAAPVFWENVDPKYPYQLIPVSKLTLEYKTVAGYVKDEGLLDKSFVSIHRIQNFDLWEMFCRKKKQLMRIQGVTHIQERRLFHGTNSTNIDTICKYNFDVRLAGQHGHVLGKGVYFARHATLADKYSQTSLPLCGTQVIFLARVIIGKSVVGKSHFQKPDDGCSENSHDSCVDKINHPNIFVIFDSNQIYPEYLIEYK